MRALKIVALLFLFLPLSLYAQMSNNYGHKEAGLWVSNIPNCVVGTNDCWHISNTTLASVSASPTQVGGLDSSGCIYLFSDYPTNSWTKKSWGCGWNHLAIGDATLICALGTWNGTTDTYCLNSAGTAMSPYGTGSSTSLSVSPDGELCKISPNTLVYCGTGGTWTALPSYPWVSISVAAANLVFAVNNAGNIYDCNPASCSSWNWYGGISGTPFTAVAAAMPPQISGDHLAYVYALAGGSVYSFNGTSFDHLSGTGFTSLSTGSSMMTFAVGPTQSGANVWRFPDLALSVSSTLSGSATCQNQQLCNGAQHQGHVTVTFAGKHTGGGEVYGVKGPYNAAINVTGSDTTWDPFGCLEDSSDCQIVTSTDGVDCSVLGPNYFDASNIFSIPGGIHSCEASFKNIGELPGTCAGQWDPATKAYDLPPTECDYGAAAWCSNTSNPDFSVSFIRDLQVVGDQTYGWTTILGICFREGGYSATGTPWLHIPIPYQMKEVLHYFSPTVCTYNP